MLILYFLTFFSASRTKGFSKDGTFPSDKYRSLLGLVTNTEKRSVQDLFRRSLDASFILYFLATCTNMFGNPLSKDLSVLIKNADVTFVGGLILRHQQLIPSNFHSVCQFHIALVELHFFCHKLLILDCSESSCRFSVDDIRT